MISKSSIPKLIQPGDIVLTFDKESAISTAIAEVTNSKWSHSMLYIGSGKLIDTTPNGVVISSLGKYVNTKYRVGLFRLKDTLSPEEIEKVIQAGRKLLGIEYSWWQIAWDFVLRLIGKSEDRDWAINMDKGMVCSEFVAKAYEAVGIKFKNIPAYQMEPCDFDESPITDRIA